MRGRFVGVCGIWLEAAIDLSLPSSLKDLDLSGALQQASGLVSGLREVALCVGRLGLAG